MPHQPRRVVLKRKDYFRRGRGLGGPRDVQAHGVGGRVVQHQHEVIEAHDLMKPAGQLTE
jgi:hypothetical protein